MNTPLVSIIIPTYNRAHLIGETLESVLAQTYTNWECIVVDDGSTDATNELLEFYCKKDSRISYYQRPKGRPKGANACRNFGFEMSKGEYINWFDSDDLMHEKKLEIQEKILNNSELGFCVCQSLIFEGSQKKILGFRSDKLISNDIFNDYLTMKICWLTQAPLWKKEFLLKQNYLFDEELQAAQEWEFHLRILNKFSHYEVEETPLVYLRQHLKSITYNNNEVEKGWFYFQSRLKMYNNKNLNLDSNSQRFLRQYLLNSFKKLIFNRSRFSIMAFKKYILPENRMSVIIKFYSLSSIFSYHIFNKGYFLLQKIKYTE